MGGTVALWLVCPTPDRVGPSSGPGREYRVVFLGETLYSHSASLYPGVFACDMQNLLLHIRKESFKAVVCLAFQF